MSAISERLYALRRALQLLVGQPVRFVIAAVLVGLSVTVLATVSAVAFAWAPALRGMQAGPEVNLFLKGGTAQRETDALRDRLAAMEGVSSVQVISREQALAELGRKGSIGPAADARSNPLPDTLTARFPLGTDPGLVERAASAARQWSAVDAVQVDIDWYRRLMALLRLTKRVGAIVGGVLALLAAGTLVAAALLVVRVPADEARVLRFAGARPRFMRRPYVYAGALTFGLGAFTALAAPAAWLIARGVPRLPFGTEPPDGAWLLGLPAVAVAAAALLGSFVASRVASRQIKRALR